MNLLIADTRKDVGRGHQSRVAALHHALGGHIVEMDDSVPCGIRLDGELICQGLEYALIRPEVVALRPEKPRPAEAWDTYTLRYPEDSSIPARVAKQEIVQIPAHWEAAMAKAERIVAPCGVTILEACCLGVPFDTWVAADNQRRLYRAIIALSHGERFEVIDGKGAERVAEAIKMKLSVAP